MSMHLLKAYSAVFLMAAYEAHHDFYMKVDFTGKVATSLSCIFYHCTLAHIQTCTHACKYIKSSTFHLHYACDPAG